MIKQMTIEQLVGRKETDGMQAWDSFLDLPVHTWIEAADRSAQKPEVFFFLPERVEYIKKHGLDVRQVYKSGILRHATEIHEASVRDVIRTLAMRVMDGKGGWDEKDEDWDSAYDQTVEVLRFLLIDCFRAFTDKGEMHE